MDVGAFNATRLSVDQKETGFGLILEISFIIIKKISNFEDIKNVNNYYFNVFYIFSINI